jgi:cytoskeletal protein CcmA (bactofilin family)
MLASQLPLKVTQPWANAAGAGYIRQPPNGSQIGITAGAASFADGFPPLNFQPVSSGGIPPYGQDMNGLQNQITAWLRWQAAGGDVWYDATFQSAIGGYPAAAKVMSATTANLTWWSTVDNNLTNPDSSGAGWSVPTFADPGTAAIRITGPGASGANILLAGSGATPNKTIRATGGNFSVVNNAYSAEILTLTDTGNLTVPGNLTGNTITGNTLQSNGNINASGTITGNVAVNSNGAMNAPGTITGGAVNSNGNMYAAGTITGNAAVNSNGTLGVTGNGQVNGQLVVGTGLYAGTYFSPHAFNGREWNFSVDSNGTKYQTYRAGGWYDAWNAQGGTRYWNTPGGAMTLDGSGNLNTFGNITGLTLASNNGNVQANNGRLRAAYGAYGSGDGNAATLLNDFVFANGNPQGWLRLPNGLLLQWGQASTFNWTLIAFNVAFPNACMAVWCTEGAAAGTWEGPTPTVHAGTPQGTANFIHWTYNWNGNSWINSNNTCYWLAIGW